MAIKVIAIRRGWFGTFREPGETFEIADKSKLGKWMKVLESKPEKVSESKSDEPKAGDLVKLVNDSDDVDFITFHLESGFATVRAAAEKRLEELKG
jgi:hypothetical protein